MKEAIVFAVITATVFGLWTFLHQLASEHINSLFGAIVVSATAALLGLIFLLPKIRETTLVTNQKGIIFAVLAGVSALGIDFFALKAYGSGGQASIVGPIIIAGSIAVVSILGFLTGDSFTVTKVIGLAFIIFGSGILAAVSN